MPAGSAKWLITQLIERAFSVDRILSGTGLKQVWLKKENAKISPSQYCTLVLNALELTGDPALGLKIFQQADLNWHGFWGYAIMSSPTLGDASRISQKFWELNGSLVKIDFNKGKETSAWDIQPAFPMKDHRVMVYAVEEWLSAVQRDVNFMTGRELIASEIRLAYPEPEYSPLYRQTFKCPIHFNCPTNRLSYSSKYLTLSLVTTNPEVAQLCVQQCEKMLAELSRSDELIDTIHRLIVISPGHYTKAEAIAKQLGISSRSLSRRLNERNTTFHSILNEIRLALAKEYLLNTDFSIDQIAYMVGFSETSSFRRAFKTWTGSSASVVRKSRNAND